MDFIGNLASAVFLILFVGVILARFFWERRGPRPKEEPKPDLSPYSRAAAPRPSKPKIYTPGHATGCGCLDCSTDRFLDTGVFIEGGAKPPADWRSR